MKTNFTALIVLVLGVFGLVGCATIVGGGSTQEINFDSNPAGAEIWMGNLKNGEVINLVNSGSVTPKSIVISRKDAVIILKKEGYKDTNVIMTKTTNDWFFGNFLIGGLIGSSIDSSTGAIHKYDPNNFFVELEKNDTAE